MKWGMIKYDVVKFIENYGVVCVEVELGIFLEEMF